MTMSVVAHLNGVSADPTHARRTALDGSRHSLLNKPLPFFPRKQPASPVSLLPGPAPGQTAEQAVDSLARQALRHQAVRHPYLTALALGELPDQHSALRDFARQYHAYSAHFPRYLTAVISKLDNPDHRQALLENLMEESGHYEQEELEALAAIGIAPEWIVGLPHPELFRRFRRALGVMDADTCSEAIEVVC